MVLGQRGVHYHQFLTAGENTLNFQLATRLHEQTCRLGCYDADVWLEEYVRFMLTPGSHRDTYVEECHRWFFTNYARKPRVCGVADVHIGGLAAVPALSAALPGVGESVYLLAVPRGEEKLRLVPVKVVRADGAKLKYAFDEGGINLEPVMHLGR